MDKTKYVRILKREVREKVRYFVQLIQEGYPPTKRNRKVADDETKRVGIDIGTSTIAISSKNKIELQELAPECKPNEKEIRRIQRKMDRSKRSTNPNNFNDNGTVKKGRLTWKYSNRYKNLRQNRKELYRKIAVQRKMSHEKLANDILALGSDVRVETMRFQSLQKRAKNTTRNRSNGKINLKQGKIRIPLRSVLDTMYPRYLEPHCFSCGSCQVTLDLLGYNSGSMNKVLGKGQAKPVV
jgi:hypothetical protein